MHDVVWSNVQDKQDGLVTKRHTKNKKKPARSHCGLAAGRNISDL